QWEEYGINMADARGDIWKVLRTFFIKDNKENV
ncbi:unnamed protein product, partial [marine sediment metagenome]